MKRLIFTPQLKFINTLIMLGIALLTSPSSLAIDKSESEFVVVINLENKSETFNKQQLRHIFMGGTLSHAYTAINLPSGHPLRMEFNTKIVGLTESRIQAYWAQMKFTGRSKPPMEKSSSEEALTYLEENAGAITYLPADMDIPDNLTIVYP